MYTLRVKKRDYLRISVILSMVWLGGMILSFYLYDEIVDGILRWVRKQILLDKKNDLRFLSFSANAN